MFFIGVGIAHVIKLNKIQEIFNGVVRKCIRWYVLRKLGLSTLENCFGSILVDFISKLQCKHITLFRSITMLCGTNNILQNIPHIQIEYGEYFVEYCQSHITLLWI